jgi:hypothetical protein
MPTAFTSSGTSSTNKILAIAVSGNPAQMSLQSWVDAAGINAQIVYATTYSAIMAAGNFSNYRMVYVPSSYIQVREWASCSARLYSCITVSFFSCCQALSCKIVIFIDCA